MIPLTPHSPDLASATVNSREGKQTELKKLKERLQQNVWRMQKKVHRNVEKTQKDTLHEWWQKGNILKKVCKIIS